MEREWQDLLVTEGRLTCNTKHRQSEPGDKELIMSKDRAKRKKEQLTGLEAT
jgi:hypothetical protein